MRKPPSSRPNSTARGLGADDSPAALRTKDYPRALAAGPYLSPSPTAPSRTPRRNSVANANLEPIVPTHWLFPKTDRCIAQRPFIPPARDPDESEQDPLRPDFYDHSQRLDNRQGRFHIIYGPHEAYNSQCGTIVIPRRQEDADLVVAIATSSSNTTEANPQDPSVVARFLVCSQTMRHCIPSFNHQFESLPGLNEAQRLGPAAEDLYNVIPWVMREVDVTAAWIVLISLHGRWPIAWKTLDIPLETLFNIARFVALAKIYPESRSWSIIRGRLDRTLRRQRGEFGRPTHPCVGQWLYIAHIFKLEEDFAALWANLAVTTWRFTPQSSKVNRYSGGFDGDPLPAHYQGWWYNVGQLRSRLKLNLMDDCHKLILRLGSIWAQFERAHQPPIQDYGALFELMRAPLDFRGSAQDLREAIDEYATSIAVKLRQAAVVSDQKINARGITACTKLCAYGVWLIGLMGYSLTENTGYAVSKTIRHTMHENYIPTIKANLSNAANE
ncbi:hypothetical protein DRE_04164 [Drechslerella stenobrocha 248]|uniref:Uncharacterized protein n=1 Tax=Drechslerella stenobrocha 248 TaxID=1043628 RepID=W7I2N7_9PEZI|nr:hypothetical protein DRE_04164 [Drechslerella stenobrocha 248]